MKFHFSTSTKGRHGKTIGWDLEWKSHGIPRCGILFISTQPWAKSEVKFFKTKNIFWTRFFVPHVPIFLRMSEAEERPHQSKRKRKKSFITLAKKGKIDRGSSIDQEDYDYFLNILKEISSASDEDIGKNGTTYL
jgi:hypothetical protein